MRTQQEQWLKHTTKNASHREIAKAIGTSGATISRHLAAGKIKPEFVIAIARVYGVNPAQALVDTGYLEPHELVALKTMPEPGLATTQELLGELRKRLDPEATRLYRSEGAPPPTPHKAKVVPEPDHYPLSLVDIYAADDISHDEPVKDEPEAVEPHSASSTSHSKASPKENPAGANENPARDENYSDC